MKDHLLKKINTSTQSHGYDNILSSMYNKLDLHNVIRITEKTGISDLTTRFCPVQYRGQQWVVLYFTPR